MRALSRIAAGVVLFVLLLVAAAWFVPQTLDWSRYRTTIATLATRQLGRDVSIDGPVSLTLLPRPALLASRVTVAEAGDGIKLSVKVARLSVALWPLLAGRIDAQELALRGLDLSIPGPLDSKALNIRPPALLRARSAQIEEGRVAIGGVVLTGIEATLWVDELTGGYRTAGTTEISGDVWRFTGLLSQPGGDGSTAVAATLDGQGRLQGASLALSGQVQENGVFGGLVRSSGPDLSQLIAAPRLPFRAEGRINVASGLAVADDLEIQVGNAPARAAVSFRLSPAPRLDIAVATSQLDLDLWLPVLRNHPPSLDLGLDVSAESAPLAGGTLRRLRAAFDIGPDRATVREFTASLPGDADVHVTGELTESGNAEPRFEGDARLDAPSARATLAWLETAKFAAAPVLPDGLFHEARASAHLIVQGGALAMTGLTGALDGRAFSGALAGQIRGRPNIKAQIRIAKIDFAALDMASLPPQAKLATMASSFDLDLQLKADRAALPNMTLAPVAIDMALDQGNLTLRRFDAVVNEAHVVASGWIGADGRLADGRCEIDGGSIDSLTPLAPAAMTTLFTDLAPLARRKFAVAIEASGPPSALALHVAADLDDLRIQAGPVVDMSAGRLDGPITLHHPGASRFAELLGLRGAPAWLGDGSFGAVATLAVSPSQIAISSFDITAGVMHAAGDIVVDRVSDPMRVAGKIQADTIPIPIPFPRSIDPLATKWLLGYGADIDVDAREIDIPGLPPIRGASGKIGLNDGTLSIKMPQARLSGGNLSGTMAFAAKANPPRLTLTGGLTKAAISGPLFETPIDITGGALTMTLSVAASGHSPAAILSTLAGAAHAEVDDGAFAGADLGSIDSGAPDAAIRKALAGGSTKFDSLIIDGVFERGELRLSNTILRSAPADIRIAGSIDLASDAADLKLSLIPAGADSPRIGLRVTGSLDAPLKTPEFAELAQWRAEHPAIPDPTVVSTPAR